MLLSTVINTLYLQCIHKFGVWYCELSCFKRLFEYVVTQAQAGHFDIVNGSSLI